VWASLRFRDQRMLQDSGTNIECTLHSSISQRRGALSSQTFVTCRVLTKKGPNLRHKLAGDIYIGLGLITAFTR
jgi:hypothetical protein